MAAIVFEDLFDVTDSDTTTSGGNLNPTVLHSLQNTSGNDRLVIATVTSFSQGTAGDITVATAAQYNGVAPTGSLVEHDDGKSTNRDFLAMYWWDDSALPAGLTAAPFSCDITLGNMSSRALARIHVIEYTGVNQTSPIRASGTNETFGTGTQSSSTIATSAQTDEVVVQTICGGVDAGSGDTPTTSSPGGNYTSGVLASGAARMAYAVARCSFASGTAFSQTLASDTACDLVMALNIAVPGAAGGISGGMAWHLADKLRFR